MKEHETLLEEWLDESDENRKLFAEEGLILDVTEEIWAALERKGWSKSQLADALGLSLSHVSRLLNGSRNMTLRTLADIAYALGMRPSFSFVENLSPVTEGDDGWKTVEVGDAATRAVATCQPEASNTDNWSEPCEIKAA